MRAMDAPADAADVRRNRERERKRRLRLAAGRTPRAQYEATSKSHTKPWLSDGYNTRRTWERHGKPVPAAVTFLARYFLSGAVVASVSHPILREGYVADTLATRRKRDAA